jgi:F0F1-type ATP synthase beta subunit
MDSTDGLYRGQAVVDLGTTITVPVGKGTLGRVMNVLGDPIDKLGPITATEYRSIHAKPPTFLEQVRSFDFILQTSELTILNSHQLSLN